MSKPLGASVGLILAVVVGAAADLPPLPSKTSDLKPLELVLEDQFERRQDLAAYRGEVVVLVYADRKGLDSALTLGERLHILFHPTAAGLPAAKARTAPVAPLQGVPAGKRSPDVVIIPVAVGGASLPGVIKDLMRGQLKKASPEVPVWLDFAGVLEREFGLRAGQPNLVVCDATGRPRMKVTGTPDQPTTEKMLQTIQNLRAEAAGLGRDRD